MYHGVSGRVKATRTKPARVLGGTLAPLASPSFAPVEEPKETALASWKDDLTRVVHGIEHGFDTLKHRIKRGRLRDPLMVLPYLTYGTRERVLVKGRVLEDKNVRPARATDTVWSNLKNAYKRFDSDEVPNAEVRVRLGGADTVLTTDREGFFEAWIEPPETLPAEGYLRDAQFELLSPHAKKQERTHFPGRVLVPPAHADFGVISDVDDTVLITEATSTLSLLRKILFGNARTRLPFTGVAGFYRALHQDRNPIFYVSSSPWNLYDLLTDFLRLNDIPEGPLLLRDWGISPTELLPTEHSDHKHEAIEEILDTYPDMPFLLIGDSGQEDPEIYREVVARHPGQIRGIYIRSVTDQAARRDAIARLAAEVDERGVPLVLVANTLEAARDAAQRGWIARDDVDRVAEAMRAEAA